MLSPLTRVLVAIGLGGSAPVAVPTNTVAPVASGAVETGGSLSCTTGTWTGAPSAYAYQWQRDGVNIGGATLSTYTPVIADVAAIAITCNVTATNAGGASAPASSNGLAYSLASLASVSAVLDETHQTGSPISSWTPSAGAFAGFTATTTQRPAAGRAINGHAAPDFNGSSNLMGSTSIVTDLLAVGGYEYWIVFLADVVSSTGADVRQNHCLLGDGNDILYATLKSESGVPTLEVGHYDGAVKWASLVCSVGAAHVVNVSFNGSRVRAAVDGGTDATYLSGNINSANQPVKIGETAFGAVFFDGAYGCLVACKAEQTSGKRADATAFLKAKYGVA